MKKVKLNDWQVENLRATIFTSISIDASNNKFWKELLDSEPDEVVSRPHQQFVAEIGQALNGRLSVETNVNRIDWILQFNFRDPILGLPVIGPYEDIGLKFQKLIRDWIKFCPSVYRLAYGGVLLLPANSMKDAYSKLGNLLETIKIDSENTHDLHFRVNRKRKSECSVSELEINRISTWNVIQLIEGYDMSMDGQNQQIVTKFSDPKSVCRLELDINTNPEINDNFNKDDVQNIFNELFEFGNQIATEGDKL